MTSNKKSFRWGGLAVAGTLFLSAVGVGAVAVGGCRQAAPAAAVAAAPATSFDVTALDGKWFIVASDLSTWTSGEKASPALHYKVQVGDDGLAVMEDRATFIEGGSHAEYKGTDTQESLDSLSFNWRGSGVLALVSTRWHLMHVSSDKSWAIAFYEKTVATPAGVAVLSRTPQLPAAAFAEARSYVAGHGALKEHAEGLRAVAQTDNASSGGS